MTPAEDHAVTVAMYWLGAALVAIPTIVLTVGPMLQTPPRSLPVLSSGRTGALEPQWSEIKVGLSKLAVEALIGLPTSTHGDDLWIYDGATSGGNVLFHKGQVYLITHQPPKLKSNGGNANAQF